MSPRGVFDGLSDRCAMCLAIAERVNEDHLGEADQALPWVDQGSKNRIVILGRPHICESVKTTQCNRRRRFREKRQLSYYVW